MDPLTIGNESPPARQSILGSFLRARPRGASQSHPSPPPLPPIHDSPATRDSPPPVPSANDPTSGHRRRAAAPNLQTSLSQSPSTPGFSQMLRRRRSAGTLATTATPQVPLVAVARTPVASSAPAVSTVPHRIRLVPHLDNRRSLRFEPIARDVKEGEQPLRIGRFTDRSGLGLAAANALGSNKLAFKSKVVSRAHAEIWVESGGRFLIKDTKSSSGTFLNHVRLSPANTESRPTELRDGDLLQLGVDYQGGAEDIYKCVKIKVEVGREWQTHSNPFNANALKQLKAIALPQPQNGDRKAIHAKSTLPDCCICLFAVTIRQALFIAPCSHAFHYKCIRPLLDTHHPAFSCPLCRTFANLEEDVEIEIDGDMDVDTDSIVAATPLAANGDRPGTGDGSSRERERERERDAGAETEVEPDTGASRLGSARGRRQPPLQPNLYLVPQDVEDVVEDVDAEMADEDEAPLPPLPESASMSVDVALENERDASESPVPDPAPGPAGGLVSLDDESEGSGGSALDGADDNGRVDLHQKRKR